MHAMCTQTPRNRSGWLSTSKSAGPIEMSGSKQFGWRVSESGDDIVLQVTSGRPERRRLPGPRA
jgi:hypothetical protein